MSHLIGILLALVSLAVTTCRALPDFHKQMSPQQLQSIFHVDSADAVPHYEVVQLLHHNHPEPATQTHHSHYKRRKRSVEPLQQMQDLKQQARDSQHVKKDLSKNPYYSQLKEKSSMAVNSNSVYQAAKADKEIKNIKEHKVSFNAFGKDLNLTLKQTQGLFKNGQVHRLPMWYVDNETNTTHGLNLQKIEDELNHTSDNVGQVFQDEENMAAILMRRHEVTGDLVMEGSIGHDMVIKPLPHDLTPHQKESSHHVIFKREVDTSEHLSDFAFMEPDDMATSEKLEKLQNRHKRSAHRTTLEDIELEEEQLEADEGLTDNEFASHKRAKRQAPYIIYPEILVIVDYDGYRLHGGDNLQVKRYFISFWNGVDLRYRLLKGPRIRISIAGIIISRGRDATPYLERNRVGRDAIDSAAALTDMGKYLFRERRLPVYDIAVAITKYDMCRRRKGGRCTKGTAGFAYVGGACVVNKRLEKVNSVAIIEDTGGFSGIIVAAHEVGHLLGAVHDGSPPPSYLGGPGAQRCRWEDGYIMSDLRHTERGFRWSPCTVQSFHHFLNGDTATCLHNAPHEDSALGRSLPGTLLSLDAQCRRDRGTYACFKDERVCAQLFCFDAQTGYCVAYRPAAEGSSCGNSLHCLDGRCTPLPSNAIPNYGHQYRLGYKSNEAIGDDFENKSKDLTKDDDDDDEEEDDEEEDEEDEEDSSEEDEGGEEQDNEKEEEEVDSNYSDNQTSTNVNDNDDDDELYLTEPLNEFNKNLAISNNHNNNNNNNNHIDLRNDNNVDETMLKIKDEPENSINLIKYPTTTNHTQNTNLFNLNTYQYLAQLWQNLQTTTATTTITTTTTTRKPLMGYQQHHKQKSPEQVQLQQHSNKLQGQGHVVVKTSTKTSISSSSESTRNLNKANNHKLTATTKTQPQQTPQHNTLDTTTTTTPTTTTTSTLLKSLRKQFQYYLKLFQDNNSNSNNNSRNNRYLNNNKQNYHRQTILPSKPYSNSLQNAASATATATNEDNLQQDEEHDDNDEDEGDASSNNEGNSNGGDDNDESNETIEKLKRKLSIPLTTKTLQLQQQQKQQQLPTTAMPLTSSYLGTATPRYGSKSTTSSTGRSSLATPTFFENYFKKIQNQNNSNHKPATTAAELTRTAENKSKLKIHTKNAEDKEHQNHNAGDEEADEDEDKSVTTFEAQFLKRTPAQTSKNEDDNDAYSSSSSLNTNNPYYNTKTTASRSSNHNHNNNSNNRQNSNNNNKNNESILLVTPPATRPQTPPYVTNYIGDNTQQRLTTIRHQQQPQQQQQDTATTTTLQQYNSHQHVSTTPPFQPSPNQQYESLYLLSSTTRRPKIKTQKLIRRLRTQIK